MHSPSTVRGQRERIASVPPPARRSATARRPNAYTSVRRTCTSARSPPPTITASAEPRSSVIPFTEPRTENVATLRSRVTSHHTASASPAPSTSTAQPVTSSVHGDRRRRPGAMAGGRGIRDT